MVYEVAKKRSTLLKWSYWRPAASYHPTRRSVFAFVVLEKVFPDVGAKCIQQTAESLLLAIVGFAVDEGEKD